MKIKQSLWISIIFLLSFTVSQGQIVKKSVPQPSTSNFSAQAVKSSAAYAELLLRKTEREAQLEEFLLDYTEEFPKVREIKFELGILQKQLDKVLALNTSDAPKLSLALGKLLVRKTELDVELWNLLGQYNADHPEVKRTKRKLEVYDAAIKEILP